MRDTARTLLICTLASLPLAAGCAGTQVKRLDAAEVKDLSGRWNDTDSRLTAEEMISDCLARPWVAKAKRAGGREPAVIVGTVRNESDEHINTNTFVEDLQRALINSGQVEFVASREERGHVRRERLDQDRHSSDETRKEHGQETGADFMLSGVINTVSDQEGGQSVKLYQVNLKLLNMKTNQIAWNGQKKIKKFVKRPRVSW